MINNFLVFLFATVLSLPYTTSRNPGKVDSSICVLSCFSQGHTMFEAKGEFHNRPMIPPDLKVAFLQHCR